MERTRRLLAIALTACVAVGVTVLSNANFPTSPASAITGDEEEYVYEVSWTVFKLGTIRLKTLPGLRAEAYIDSYPNLPFVDLHSIHYSQMDSLFFSHGSLSLEKRKNEWWGLDYVNEPGGKRVRVDELFLQYPGTAPRKRTIKDTLYPPSAVFVDGLSIAYFPRRFIHTNQSLTVPTILYGKLGQTTFHFSGEHTTESIDALEDPVRVVPIEGNTTVEGIFGMTGDFKGWFSDDAAAVPIKGKLKVLLGNVTVELVKWNRKGWNPPQ